MEFRTGLRIGVGLIIGGVLAALLVEARPGPNASGSPPATLEPARAPAEARAPEVDAGEAPAPRLPSVEGLLTLHGVPVDGIQVRASMGQTSVTTTTQAGHFEFFELAEGSWVIDAASGDALVHAQVEAPSEGLWRFALQGAWRLEGTVRSSTGAPIGGASVTLCGFEQPARLHLVTVSGADGRYQLRTTDSQTWLRARAPGFARSPLVETAMITSSARVDFVLEPEAVLSGVVVGADAVGIEGATLSVDDVWAETDWSGHFRLEQIAAGPHELQVYLQAPGGGESEDFQLTAHENAPASDLRIVVSNTCALEGRVLAPAGPPPESTEVSANISHRRFWATRTDALGAFRLADFPCTGIVELEVAAPPEVKVEKKFELTAPTTRVELHLPRLRQVTGVVTRLDGTPIPEAALEAYTPRRSWLADDQGRFTLTYPEDVKTASITAWASHLESKPVERSLADLSEWRIALAPERKRAVLRGKVLDETGAPLREFVVAGERVTSETGRFEIAREWQPSVEVWAEDRPSHRLPWRQGDLATDLGTVVLDRGRRLQALVLDAKRQPVGGASLYGDDFADPSDLDAQSRFADTFADGFGEYPRIPATGYWVWAAMTVTDADGGTHRARSAPVFAAPGVASVELQLRER